MIPDSLDFLIRLYATHLKKPTLSNTIDMTMVDIIVIEAPLTILKITVTSDSGTIPTKRTRKAAIEVGTVSLIPLGFHTINEIVSRKSVIMKVVWKSTILFRLFSYRCIM
jgi:hypothetical protein